MRALLIVLALAGCASAPPERFYALPAAVEAAAIPVESSGRTVVVGPAAVPALVDRPQLVMQAGADRVNILEQQRWAEPLRTGVSRVVAENLARLLGSWRVSTRDDVIRTPDCRVNIDIRRFDSRLDAAVRVEALWSVACAGSAKRVGQSAVETRIAAPHLDAVVAAQGRALATVSRDIAEALRSTRREYASQIAE